MTPEQLKASILQYAMEGKLVKQDPNDEPASVLVEKIKAEKDKLIKEGKIKKTKKLSEISYDEKPFDIPDSWEWVRLGDYFTILRGGSPRPIKDYLTEDPNGINWIKIGDTRPNDKYITSTKEKIKKEGLVKSREVKVGDFLLSNSMSFGRPYIVKINGAVHDGWLIIKDYSILADKNFLYYLLSSSLVKKQFIKAATGSTVKNLNRERVANTVVAFPPLTEQKRIVAKIEKLMPLVDEYAESYNRLKKIDDNFDEKLKQSILQYAMEGKLVKQNSNDESASVLVEKIKAEKDKLIKEGKIKKTKKLHKISDDEEPFDIPDSWEWVRLDSLLKSESHIKPKSNFNYIDIASLNNKTNTISSYKFIDVSKDKIPVRATQFVNEGDILYSTVRPYLKNIAIVPSNLNDSIATSGYFVAKLLDKQMSLYLFYVLLSPYTTDEMHSRMKGLNSPSVKKSDLQNWVIPLPPLEEQKRIVTKIDKLMNFIKDKENN